MTRVSPLIALNPPEGFKDEDLEFIGKITEYGKDYPPQIDDLVFVTIPSAFAEGRQRQGWVKLAACDCKSAHIRRYPWPKGDICGPHIYTVDDKKTSYGIAWNAREKYWILTGYLFRLNYQTIELVQPVTKLKIDLSCYCTCNNPVLEKRDAGIGPTSIPYNFCLSCRKERQ